MNSRLEFSVFEDGRGVASRVQRHDWQSKFDNVGNHEQVIIIERYGNVHSPHVCRWFAGEASGSVSFCTGLSVMVFGGSIIIAALMLTMSSLCTCMVDRHDRRQYDDIRHAGVYKGR